METFSWMLILSAIWSPTVNTGFRAVMGSWKIMDTSLPRTFSSSLALMLRISWPLTSSLSQSTTPGGSGTSRRMDRAVVVLPAPVSPTRPMALPFSMRRSRPLTALTTPSSVANRTDRFSMSSTRSFLFSSWFMASSCYCFSLGSSASRRPSPIRLKARTVIMIARPGKVVR